jgi:hypothetical protein
MYLSSSQEVNMVDCNYSFLLKENAPPARIWLNYKSIAVLMFATQYSATKDYE